MWRRLAWVMRYTKGGAQLETLLAMDTRALFLLADELQAIVEAENKPRK